MEKRFNEMKELAKILCREAEAKRTTTDVDGAFANAIMKVAYPKLPLKEVFTFTELLSINPLRPNKIISLDAALREDATIDNHMMREGVCSDINEKSINLNNLYEHAAAINGENYKQKYAMSTSIFMYPLFGVPLPTTRGIEYLLMIDGGYKGFFDDKYKEPYLINLKVLGLESLIDVLLSHSYDWWQGQAKDLANKVNIRFDKNGFARYATFKYNYKTKQKEFAEWTDKTYIEALEQDLQLDLSLPTEPFSVIEKFEYKVFKKGESNFPNDLINDKNYFSFAFTTANELKVSKKMKLVDGEWVSIPDNEELRWMQKFLKKVKNTPSNALYEEFDEYERQRGIDVFNDGLNWNIRFIKWFKDKFDLKV